MKIEDEIRLTDLETLKVIGDPLRMQLLEQIGLASDSGLLTTVKQLAEALDIHPTKLYYHINLLEKHGLIVVAETRVVSGIIEKHYQVRARKIRADLDISKNTKINRNQGISIVLSSIANMFDVAQKNVEKSFQQRLVETEESDSDSLPLFTTQAILQLSPDQAKAFITRVKNLINEFDEIKNPKGLAFGLTMLFNPNYHIKISQNEDVSLGRGIFQDEMKNFENTSARIPPQL